MGLVMQLAAQPAALQRRRSERNWGCHWLGQAGSSTHLLRFASKRVSRVAVARAAAAAAQRKT